MFVQCLHLKMGSFLAQQMALLLIWWGIYKSIHCQLSGTLTHQEKIRLLPRKDCGALHHNWAFHEMIEWNDRYITMGYITKWSKGKLWLQFRANITAIVWQQAITCNHCLCRHWLVNQELSKTLFVIRTLHDCPSEMKENLLISNSKLTSDSELIWWR